MIDWRIIVIVIVVGILVWAAFEGRLASSIRLRQLKKNRRCISATEAIREYEDGLGMLVQNRTLLPGAWWFLRNKDRPGNCDLVTAMQNFGYVVVCNSRQERKAIERYKGEVQEMLEPLDG